MSENMSPTQSILDRSVVESIVRIRAPFQELGSEMVDMIIESGALLRGNFGLESGQRSDTLMRFASIAGRRDYVDRVASEMIRQLKSDGVRFDAVLMQEVGGRILAEAIADLMDKRKVVVETDEKNRPTGILVNEMRLYSGDRVLVVSDVATTGSGLKTMISAARKKNAVPVAVVLYATRNRDEMARFECDTGLRVYALIDLVVEDRTVSPDKASTTPWGREPLVYSWQT